VFQEIIKTTQIGRFDRHVRRRRQLGAAARQGDHGLGRQRLLLSQEITQRLVHGRLAVVGGVLQNPQIGAAGHIGSVFVLQSIVGHPKAAVGEQVLAVTVVVKGAWLAHQLVDEVAVVDGVLVAPNQARQRVHVGSRVPDFHALGIQPGFDFVADQTAVHRVGVTVQVDQAARAHAHAKPQTTVLPLGRQGLQHGDFLGVALLPPHVARGHHLLQKAAVFVAAAEIAAAPQEQRLLHGVFEMSMRRLTVAVLVRLANIDPLAGQAIMVQQATIAGLKLAFDRQVVDRRAQAVAAMAARHASQFPQGILQTVGQRLERFRGAKGHGFPVGVGEHEVIDQVLEALAEDGDTQRVHAGEIRGRQVAGVMHLAEHDRPRLTRRGPPALNAALEGAALALGQPPGMFLLEPVKQRFGLQARLRFEPFLGLLPQVGQRILPGPIGARPLLRTGQSTQCAILACRLLVHSGPPGSDRQALVGLQVLKQFSNLSIRDHRKAPCCKELRVWSIHAKIGNSNCRWPRLGSASAGGRPGNLIDGGREN
jgi:hypothetical protein